MKTFIFALFAFTFFPGATPPAEASSYYQWRGGSCYEVTPGGSIIQQVNNNRCRNRSGSRPEWRGGTCYEVTPNGSIIQQLNNNRCRNNAGSRAEWRGGSCYEVTPGGSIIQQLNNNRCRNNAGSRVEWRGGSCYEVTPGGSIIQQVNNNRCRNSPYAFLNPNEVLKQLANYQAEDESDVNTESRALKPMPAYIQVEEREKSTLDIAI